MYKKGVRSNGEKRKSYQDYRWRHLSADRQAFETASRKKSVRLADVDAPEKGKPGSAKATEALRKMLEDE